MDDDFTDELDGYPNRDAVWADDDLTQLIQERIDTMPDMPEHVAILLSWQDSDDDSIISQYQASGAFYDELALKWLGKPLRLFFLALDPDSSLSVGEFFGKLPQTSFSECFYLVGGKAALRTTRFESRDEAIAKHRLAFGRIFESLGGDQGS